MKGFIELLESGLTENLDQIRFDEKDLLIFQHIPKTGGVSLSEFLRANLKPWYIVKWFDVSESWRECLSDLDNKGYKLVGGHLTYEHLQEFPWSQRKANLIAFIRHPIERIISHYYYQLTPNNPPYEAFKEKYPSLENYIQSLPNNCLTNYWLLDQKVSDFEEAISLLNQRYSFIGLTEFSYFSTFIISSFLSIDFDGLKHNNINKFSNYKSLKSKIYSDKNLMSLLISKNSLDLQIYNHIHRLYQSNMDMFIEHLNQEKKTTVSTAPSNIDNMSINLIDSIKEAYLIGKEMNLNGCHYGLWHDGKKKLDKPMNYYYFLAGLCKTKQIVRVLEIGTYRGGSTLAMLQGIEIEKADILTIDIELFEPNVLENIPQIKRIIGDSLDSKVISEVVNHFKGQKIDLIYIDGLHTYESTIAYYGIYTMLLRPRFVVIDDITLNEGMSRMWRDIKKTHDCNALNAAKVDERIRPGKAGFGVIQLDT